MQTEINGKSNVVTFRNKAATVIQEFYNQNKFADLNTEKLKMVQTTTKLIQDKLNRLKHQQMSIQHLKRFNRKMTVSSSFPKRSEFIWKDF